MTAVPGRTVAVWAGAGWSCDEVCRVLGAATALEVVAGRPAVTTAAVMEGDAGLVVPLLDPAREVADAAESALAGAQAASARTARIDPARAGRWRSDRRIMRRDKHFRA
ncbi:hypothetical protein ASG91_17480 [Phycicoccus sp. Soil802]|nr:hypothetical protein ASG91_17480 [Phycicoccus sp. Soil802]